MTLYGFAGWNMRSPPPPRMIVIALMLSVGFVAFFLREIFESLTYPLIEIGVGLATAVQSVSPEHLDLARLVALPTGLRIVVDGSTRFFKFLESEKSPTQAVPC